MLKTEPGRSAFSVLFFQDLAFIPMLALLPLLGVSSAQEVTTGRWNGMLSAILVIGGIIFAGRTFIRPLFRLIASTRVR